MYIGLFLMAVITFLLDRIRPPGKPRALAREAMTITSWLLFADIIFSSNPTMPIPCE